MRAAIAAFIKTTRRLMIQRELAQIRYLLAHIEQTRAADQQAELNAFGRQAELSAQLRDMDYGIQVDHETEQMVN